MDILKKIVHILANIAYVVIIIYAAVSLPLIMKYKPLVVLTGSMEPTIKTGSIIYYKPVSENELQQNDIITFESNNSLVTHRIVNIENGLIETRGDANNTNDPNKIKYDDVVGRVANIYLPYLGYFIGFIQDNLLVSVIIVVAILIAEFVLSNMNRKLKEE